MEKIKFFVILLILIVSSCSEPSFGPSVDPCVWDDKDYISIDPVALTVPSGMSNAFQFIVPSDNVFRTLNAPLEAGYFNGSNTNIARIYGELIADGTACTGSRSYNLAHDSGDIGQNFLYITLPSNANFYGTAKMTIKTDYWPTQYNSSIAEYILWSGSSSDPNFPIIYGDLKGTRKTYDPSGGRIVVGLGDNRCYYQGDQYVCL